MGRENSSLSPVVEDLELDVQNQQ